MRRLAAYVLSGLLVFGLSVSNSTQAHAQSVSGLDSTFGRGGKVVTNFGNNVRPSDAALQFDGKIVISAGFDNTPAATESFGIVRYRSDGAFDGFATTAFTNFINSPNGLALQADGKIVVVGEASSADGTLSEFAVARFNTNLSLDGSFGSGGKVTTNFVGQMLGGVSNPANTVLIQPDGKLLVGGSARRCGARTCPTFTALARYNWNGSPDQTFGTGGQVMVQSIGAANALAVLTNGDILVLNESAIAQFSANGTLQPTVTSGTIVRTSLGGINAFLKDGRYILASGARDRTRHDFDVKMLRFNPTGGSDLTFNSDFRFRSGRFRNQCSTSGRRAKRWKNRCGWHFRNS